MFSLFSTHGLILKNSFSPPEFLGGASGHGHTYGNAIEYRVFYKVELRTESQCLIRLFTRTEWKWTGGEGSTLCVTIVLEDHRGNEFRTKAMHERVGGQSLSGNVGLVRRLMLASVWISWKAVITNNKCYAKVQSHFTP